MGTCSLLYRMTSYRNSVVFSRLLYVVVQCTHMCQDSAVLGNLSAREVTVFISLPTASFFLAPILVWNTSSERILQRRVLGSVELLPEGLGMCGSRCDTAMPTAG